MKLDEKFSMRPFEEEVVFLLPQFIVKGYSFSKIDGEEIIIFDLQ